MREQQNNVFNDYGLQTSVSSAGGGVNQQSLGAADLMQDHLAEGSLNGDVSKVSLFSNDSREEVKSVENAIIGNGNISNSIEERSLIGEALGKSKMEKIQIVSNHAQTLAQFEERIRGEIEEKNSLQEKIRVITRKFREKEEKLQKRLQLAEEGLVISLYLLEVDLI